MGFLDKYIDTEKAKEIRLTTPSKIFAEALRQASGSSFTRDVRYKIYYQVFAFYGVVDGIGTSTLVANTALCLAEAGLTVCVIDTSMLAPTQDILLKTDEAVYNADKALKHYDWFDLPFVRDSVLHVSGYSKNVSVLSFRGGRRGVIDYLSPNDSDTLVSLALSTLHNKFDIILVDCCHEMTSVNTACLQQAQQVIQVWNDSPVVIGNMETFITNAITMSCPLDKMRNVIYSRLCHDSMGSLDGVLKQYRLRHLATSYLSEEVYLKAVLGKCLFRCESTDQMVIEYTEFIIRIACHILNIDLSAEEESSSGDKKTKKDKKKKGEITVGDIREGKVEGTMTHELMHSEDMTPPVVVDKNPMGSPAFGGSSSATATPMSEEDVEAAKEAKETQAAIDYAEDAAKYSGVMDGDGITQAELDTDEDGDGIPDIFQEPDQPGKKKRRGLFGRRD